MSDADIEELEGARVLADRLELEGDPRGPMLALELAAAKAEDSATARSYNRAAQERRKAEPELAWPPALAQTKTKLRAGLMVIGDYADLHAAGASFEQLVSLRSLTLPANGVDGALEQLVQLRPRGLAPEALYQGFGLDLNRIEGRGLRAFASQGGQLPRSLHLQSGLDDVQALSGWTGLARLRLRELIHRAETLPALAPLELVELPSVVPAHVPEVAAYFADTLRSLTVCEPQTELDDFRAILELPKLEALGLQAARGLTREVLGIVASHPSIERLELSSVRPEDLELLEGMNLRELQLSYSNSALVAALPRLDSLESLTLLSGGLELGPLSKLTRLRRLELLGGVGGPLQLPPSLEHLTSVNLFGGYRLRRQPDSTPLRLSGAARLESLKLGHESPLEYEPPLLEQLRDLDIWRFEGDAHPLLDSLANTCPALEQLSITTQSDRATAPFGPPLGWRAGDRVLRALTQLRSFTIPSQTLREQAWLSQRFPELCVGAASMYWPRAAAPRRR